MRRLRLVVVLAGLSLPAIAVAQPAAMKGACASDVRTLCGSVQPGGGRIRECMREHRAQLSVECKVAIADRMLEHKGSRPNPSGGTPK